MNSKKKKNISKLKDNWHKSKERDRAERRMEEKAWGCFESRTHTTIGIKNVVSSKNKIVNLSIPNEGNQQLAGIISLKSKGEGKYKRKNTKKWSVKDKISGEERKMKGRICVSAC